MKHRNLAVVILLSIVTLGIYDLYWLVTTKNAMNERNTRNKIPSIWMLFLPMVVMTFLMILIFVLSAASTSLSEGTSNGASTGINVVVLLLGLIAVPLLVLFPFIWLLKYCKAANEFTGGEVNTAVAFILVWLLRFIGIAIIQDAFNDVVSGVNPKAPGPIAPGVTSVPQHLMQPAGGPVSPAAAPAAPTAPQAPANHDPLNPQPVPPSSHHPDQGPQSPIQ